MGKEKENVVFPIQEDADGEDEQYKKECDEETEKLFLAAPAIYAGLGYGHGTLLQLLEP